MTRERKPAVAVVAVLDEAEAERFVAEHRVLAVLSEDDAALMVFADNRVREMTGRPPTGACLPGRRTH